MTLVTTRKRPVPPEADLAESFAYSADGTRLYVRAQPGSSRVTALLCDGLACDGYIYRYLWDELTEWLSVAHFHYRGHGRSGTPADPAHVDVAAHVDDVDAVRDHLGDPEVVLVGHSLGTQVVLEAYRRRRQRVRALVLICGSFGKVTHTFKGTEVLSTVLPNLIELAAKRPRLLRALWSRFPPSVALKLAILTGDVDPARVRLADVEPYFSHALHLDFPMFMRMLSAAGDHSAQDLLGDIEVPVLVLAGSRDTFTPPELSLAMAEAIPGARLELVAGGSHILPLEERQRVREAIFAFLRDLDLDSDATLMARRSV